MRPTVRLGLLRAFLVALLLAMFGAAPDAGAHESRPAYLEIDETSPGQFAVRWRTPVLAGMRLPVVLRLPDGVRETRETLVEHLSDSVLERRWIEAGEAGLSGQRIGFPGLELTITEAVVRIATQDGRTWMGIARPNQPWVEFEADRGMLAVAADFTRQGVEHILHGFDHLLFVFGLLLLVPGRWMLVKTVTAFTVAHSITLAAATLGYVRPPAAFVEAAIAMSIVFLAVEIVRASRGETSLAIRRPWLVAFAFGLLHGFGFASVLSDAGLPQSEIPTALLFFNIGVEVGQLAFVAAVLLIARILGSLYGAWPHRARLFPAYLIGTMGAFWMLQRVSTF
jgi:hydrogenase/urease accessory protein HupE